MKKMFFILLAIVIASFYSCENDVDFDLVNNEDVFETVLIDLNLQFVGSEADGNLKSASEAQLDSLEVLMFYQKDGQWIKVAKSNFSDTTDIDLSDFRNPFTVEYYPPLRIGYILKAESRFVIRGIDSLNNNTYYGIYQVDLRNVDSEVTVTIPLVETKSYWGMNVKELTVNDYKYIFDYVYDLNVIDYENCATTLPPIDGSQWPVYYYEENSINITGQLVVEGENVTLNGVPVSFEDYIDIAEHWGSCAVNDVSLNVTVFDGTTQVYSNSIVKNWLEFGKNHYVRVENTAGVSFGFTLIDNEDIIEGWDWSSGN